MERARFLQPGELWPPPGEWTRIYIGSEYCPWLLPTAAYLEELGEKARAAGLDVTLVTPPLWQGTQERFLSLLPALMSCSRPELVINDWGGYEAAVAAGPSGPGLILGRLLSRGTAGAGRRARSDLLESASFLRYLRELNFRMVETDCLSEAPTTALAEHGLAAARYFPWAFVTLSGRCPWRFDGRRWDQGPCPKPCRGKHFTLLLEEKGLEVLHVGNAQFIADEEAAAVPKPDDGGIRRVVYQPLTGRELC